MSKFAFAFTVIFFSKNMNKNLVEQVTTGFSFQLDIGYLEIIKRACYNNVAQSRVHFTTFLTIKILKANTDDDEAISTFLHAFFIIILGISVKQVTIMRDDKSLLLGIKRNGFDCCFNA
ncbi:CLUMA_CG010856, isoform A [Clunio marinus]|uniref:CLUMA_CG010856, isoform A n=1 Tax=Clunio marinus TaxID=568069 RepID=A0A1J1IB79_9DIPT|nr:CLUMA_CG010856, isoform A [Clunio marinus]